jgi:hypothetical protein
MLHNCRTYLKINFFLSPCRSDNTEHFYGSVNQFIFFNCHRYMHGTVAVHTCDTEIQHWLKTLFLAAFTILLCGDCLATLAFRPSTGNHYITPAAIHKYIENGITTREPPSNEPVYFKFHFTHYIGFSYNNFVQKILKGMVLQILLTTDIKCFPVLNYVCQKDSYIISPVWNDCPGMLTLQCEIEKQAFPSRTHKAYLCLCL